MLSKPKIGEPCNHCGLCCMNQLCNVGAYLLGKSKVYGGDIIKGRCPALEQDGERYFCGLIKNPQKYFKSKYRPEVISRTVSSIVGSGNGCDELLDDNNPIEVEKLDILIHGKKSDPQFIEQAKKNVEMVLKFK